MNMPTPIIVQDQKPWVDPADVVSYRSYQLSEGVLTRRHHTSLREAIERSRGFTMIYAVLFNGSSVYLMTPTP